MGGARTGSHSPQGRAGKSSEKMMYNLCSKENAGPGTPIIRPHTHPSFFPPRLKLSLPSLLISSPKPKPHRLSSLPEPSSPCLVTPKQEVGKTVPEAPGDAALTKPQELGSRWELWQGPTS